jgi:hypothetical protein
MKNAVKGQHDSLYEAGVRNCRLFIFDSQFELPRLRPNEFGCRHWMISNHCLFQVVELVFVGTAKAKTRTTDTTAPATSAAPLAGTTAFSRNHSLIIDTHCWEYQQDIHDVVEENKETAENGKPWEQMEKISTTAR